jgi:hypothetical protein
MKFEKPSLKKTGLFRLYMVCSSNGEDTALSRQRCEFDSRTDYKDWYNSRSKTNLFYWKVAEWLKAADCKSALARVRGFESLPSNNQVLVVY